jgi:DDE superfamily endonuclease
MPPEANAEFVGALADTLAVYQRPYDVQRPLVCCDEGTKPWGQDVRTPLPAEAGRPERIDDEYERHGTGNLCRMFEPRAGRREVLVPERRTAVDDAAAIQHLLDVSYPSAEKIVLMQDHLNTHTLASLYEAFPPEEARRLIDQLEIHDTPKHGSWLNMAEIDWGVWRGQGLDRRLPDFPT